MSFWLENKISTVIAFVIIFIIILPTAFFVFRSWENTMKVIEAEAQISTYSENGGTTSTDRPWKN